MFVNPRLGIRRERGIWPPSKPTRGLPPPVRAVWPLPPRVDVLPCPVLRPKPLRFRFLWTPRAHLISSSFIGLELLPISRRSRRTWRTRRESQYYSGPSRPE